jgi:hypothetical protein
MQNLNFFNLLVVHARYRGRTQQNIRCGLKRPGRIKAFMFTNSLSYCLLPVTIVWWAMKRTARKLPIFYPANTIVSLSLHFIILFH